MCIKKVNSDAIKLYETSQVKLKIAGNIRKVQFTAGNNNQCPIQNTSGWDLRGRDKAGIPKTVSQLCKRKLELSGRNPRSTIYAGRPVCIYGRVSQYSKSTGTNERRNRKR